MGVLGAQLYTAPYPLKNVEMRHAASGRLDAPRSERHQQGRMASVVLAIGAAALLGWLAMQLYVGVVTLD